MAEKFNTQDFLSSAGQGDSPIQSVAKGFGIPSCMATLTEGLLSIIPSPILNAMNLGVGQGAEAAASVVRDIKKWILSWFGIGTYVDENGETVYYLENYRNGSNPATLLDTISQFIGFATGFAGEIYNEAEKLAAAYDQISQCLDSYKTSRDIARSGYEEFFKSNVDPAEYQQYVDLKYQTQLQSLAEADSLLNSYLALQSRISKVLADRAANPDLEPELIPEALDALSGLGRVVQNENDCSLVTPFGSFKVACKPKKPMTEELIRLAYKPPVSKSGKFILSLDGLYYDSQVSGIVPVLTELQNRKELIQKNINWKLEYDPNVGGRGKETNLNTIKYYVNTILDDKIVDDSTQLKPFYDRDEVLLDLIGQRNRRVFDASAQLQEAKDDGASLAIIENLKQVMLSESSHFMDKINKRKKQIELAVKMPVIYGKGSLFDPGEIPVNDFSYLEGINFQMDIDKQRKLILNHQDVSGVVMPLTVKYVQQIENSDEIVFDHLLLNSVGLGAIASDMSGVEGPQLTVNNSVEKESLFGLYNLIKFQLSQPSSVDFLGRNSSEKGESHNCQIVGRSEPDVFFKGVGIPYLEGITKNSQTNITNPSAIGSYIKLPDVRELQDFLYNQNGATFEAWIYTPNLSSNSGYNDGNVSGLYRLILANENTGLESSIDPQANILEIRRDRSTAVVRGLIFGFTRDRRFTSNKAPSNFDASNPASSSYIILAPTQSFDSSSVGFINRTFDIADRCYDISSTWYSLKVPVNTYVNNASFEKCNYEFCQISLSFEPRKNLISLYCDSELMTTATYNDVFGIDGTKEVVTIPSMNRSNSFEYNIVSMYNVSSKELKYGPELYPYFTPWIIGGGYTDGMQTGNFMGGQYGGIISGLKGHIGGIKFYSKGLTSEEVLNNYNASKNFFKNVRV